ncbi:unnamed protein product [Adineta ricciae]|uniref:Uncharacterized protein n=1 Tax=Adineta ricciae TaxID=249248 RepID=A0A814FPF0_ADIRI|nr:unnamed protein product [Adineta ricciae]CAF1323921.1 unnamed protein product [Adineta ricciae]
MDRLKRKLSHAVHSKRRDALHKDTKTASALKDAIATIVPQRSTLRSSESCDGPVFQNFRLVWLDTSTDGLNNYMNPNVINILRHIANNVNTFIDVKECVDFIEKIEDEHIILILSGRSMQPSMPAIHNMSQIMSILIFCENKLEHEVWVHQWVKIRGVYMDISTLIEGIRESTKECDRNSIAMSFIKPNSNWNFGDLDQLFIYNQIVKEIILSNKYKLQDIEKFLAFYRTQIVGNVAESKNLEKFQREYYDYAPIWWYTSQSCLSSMLSRALRLMEMEAIIKMSFFIEKLHQQLSQLHANHHESNAFIVYHSQGMYQTTFDDLVKARDGFVSFSDFLSATSKRYISMNYARQMATTANMLGILFAIKIDPSSLVSAVFANIRDEWCQETDEEILFSLYPIFRIDRITQIDHHSNRLWQVEMTLCDENDEQLSNLIKLVSEQTASLGTGWCRLSAFLLKQNQIDEAELVCQSALTQTSTDEEKATLNYQLGTIKFCQRDYTRAITFFETALKMRQRFRSSDHMDIATCYNEIGLSCEKTCEYSKALSSFEKAYDIYKVVLPEDVPVLIEHVHNVARVCCQMEQYSKSLSYYQQALEMCKKIPSLNPSDLANAHSNIGSVYEKMNDHQKAIASFIKALAIYEKNPPQDRSDVAQCYYNIGLVYDKIHEYSVALTYYEEALKINEAILSTTHPKLAATYQNIGMIYFHRADYLHAGCFYEKAYNIYVQILPSTHPDLANSYMCQGAVFEQTGKYGKAFSYYQKAHDIYQTTHPGYSLELANAYNCMSSICAKMGEHARAYRFSQCASDIEQRTSGGDRSSVVSGK